MSVSKREQHISYHGATGLIWQGARSRYRFLRRVGAGEGVQSSVYECEVVDPQQLQWTHGTVVLKMTNRGGAHQLMSEFYYLQLLKFSKSSPHIIRLLDTSETDLHFLHFLVLEKAEFSLPSLISGHAQSWLTFKTNMLPSIIQQVLQGVKALHSLHIVHNDIKSQNVVLVQDKAGWIVKLIDLGIASRVGELQEAMHFDVPIAGGQNAEIPSPRGPYDLVPPEALTAPNQPSKADPAVDIWAVGLLLTFCLTDGERIFNLEISDTTKLSSLECEAAYAALFSRIQIQQKELSDLLQAIQLLDLDSKAGRKRFEKEVTSRYDAFEEDVQDFLDDLRKKSEFDRLIPLLAKLLAFQRHQRYTCEEALEWLEKTNMKRGFIYKFDIAPHLEYRARRHHAAKAGQAAISARESWEEI